jgi:hypothetical protein
MGIRCFRDEDRLTYSIDDLDIEFTIKPLQKGQKLKIDECKKMNEGNPEIAFFETTALLMKYVLKEIKGFEFHDGSPLELEFESNGDLKDWCIDSIINTEFRPAFFLVCFNMMQGIPVDLVDAQGNKLEGVELKEIRTLKKKEA